MGTRESCVRNGKVLSTPLWISTSKGELGRQEKFGRGVMVLLVKDIATPSTVKGNNGIFGDCQSAENRQSDAIASKLLLIIY
ncbi:hypothetical protein DAPPUDRAFT_334141 [Daphnia pulex]|uniref:Uncharacterized protein n=1 Tax=Daphnia pulex TaxID=6669 RepID=E9HUU8_DAPPU|nr:hypothetical protein DAPPUDRAFT_334141 [Daphnia pulex]|eukprot:EFX64487.1 hypothetical protein DAPPUDRAFT_334141 [Daphnia pulex]